MQREHGNNIGLLRLLLASAVIVGHAPELVDGNRNRDVLAWIAPATSLGSMAVSGFFLLSGYLVTQSMLRTAALGPYLERRVLRIIPGYVVAYLLSFFALAPMLGADVRAPAAEALTNMLFLRETPNLPELQVPYPTINGALWTIAYEFRCYLLAAVLWATGLLTRRNWMLALTGGVLLATFAASSWRVSSTIDQVTRLRVFTLLFGTPSATILFTATFLVGSCIYLFRAELAARINAKTAAACTILLLPALHSSWTADLARASLFAVPLFWLALKAKFGPLQAINDRWDISYGTYLYGWPVSTVILALAGTISPLLLALISLPIAWTLGIASWFWVEKWAKSLQLTAVQQDKML